MKPKSSFFTKLFKWEHWPTYMFYVPLIPYYMYKAIKSGHMVYYLTVNPGIKYSGHGTESKFETLKHLPENQKPATIFIKENEQIDKAILKVKASNLSFPLIAKPDIGFRGYLVKKIDTLSDLEVYIKKNKVDTLIQEYINYPNECGIFYHRIPGNDTGKITSITLKKFLTVTGDGISKLADLILKDDRAFLYYDLLKNIHKDKMNLVVEKEEIVKLTVIGNHSKGTQFLNGNHLISKELEQLFDKVTKPIENWFYGRLDIKYENFEKLKQGSGFKILEVNGIISEPTHIYDPTNATYFDALKSIKKHWKIMDVIARTNHDTFEIPYQKIRPYFRELIWLRRYSKKIVQLNKEN